MALAVLADQAEASADKRAAFPAALDAQQAVLSRWAAEKHPENCEPAWGQGADRRAALLIS